MPEFNIRSDSVNVEQVMEQIRARIREKRGIDYTEEQIRELAAVKLEKMLDPRGVRSDLLEAFKKQQPSPEPPVVPSFSFEDTTMFETHRGLLRFLRKLLNPLLKLFFNPNALIHALHTQAAINQATLEREAARDKQRRDVDALYYELIHNLVFELTRTGIEVKNLKMRVESLASRLEFNERRARALESVVVYKPEEDAGRVPGPAPRASGESESRASDIPSTQAPPPNAAAASPEGPGQRSRRRRRRRGRRSGAPATAVMGGPPQSAGADAPEGGSEADEYEAGPGENVENVENAELAESAEAASAPPAPDLHPAEPDAAPEPPPASPPGTDTDQ
jgi:hypothetical protein